MNVGTKVCLLFIWSIVQCGHTAPLIWIFFFELLELPFYWSVSSTVIHTRLSLQQSGSEIKWVDGGKPLFTVSTHLVSTVYTQVNTLSACKIYWLSSAVSLQGFLDKERRFCVLKCKILVSFLLTDFHQDQHLHNFFQHCQSMDMSEQASEGELIKYLKVLWALSMNQKKSLIRNNTKDLDLQILCMFSIFLESSCNGKSCDGQLSAHNPQPALLRPHQGKTRGCGRQRYEARHWAFSFNSVNG